MSINPDIFVQLNPFNRDVRTTLVDMAEAIVRYLAHEDALFAKLQEPPFQPEPSREANGRITVVHAGTNPTYDAASFGGDNLQVTNVTPISRWWAGTPIGTTAASVGDLCHLSVQPWTGLPPGTVTVLLETPTEKPKLASCSTGTGLKSVAAPPAPSFAQSAPGASGYDTKLLDYMLARMTRGISTVPYVQSPNTHWWRINVSDLGVVTATDVGTTKP